MTDDVMTAQHAFDQAELHANTGALGSLLTDDFLSIGERGYLLDKGQWIARHAEFRFLSVDISDTDVRCYDRTAIVRSVHRTRATWRGTPLELSVRVSHVWILQAQEWKLAAVQFSSLPA